jgi:4-hydroxy-tetrahydrodipicolinate synthase
MREHFTAIAGATDRQILIYNIPYRTSVNLANETLLRLAELPNIVGVKDSSGSIAQSLDLLAARPKGFSVLTGEDALFFPLLCSGADGAILASAHIATDRFVDIARHVAANDHLGARAIWQPLRQFIAKLFLETNPIAIKHCLWRQGLIASPECRLPLTSVSVELAEVLDRLIEQLMLQH